MPAKSKSFAGEPSSSYLFRPFHFFRKEGLSMAVKNSPQKPPAPAQRPAHEIRLGRIKATIWANHGETGTWYNVTLSRTYKDGDEWKSSSSFGRDQLLTVAKVADLANSWIHDQSQSSASNGDGAHDRNDEEIPY
jgi:hypothetical protein